VHLRILSGLGDVQGPWQQRKAAESLHSANIRFSLNATDDAAEPDIRGSSFNGFLVARGLRAFTGDRKPYCVNTVLNIPERQRSLSFSSLRAIHDVQEESGVDIGISGAAGQKTLHVTSLAIEDAFETLFGWR